jgi:hypothetical protein
MKKQVKKKWSKPVINTTLKIKQTLSKPGDGTDGGQTGLNAS